MTEKCCVPGCNSRSSDGNNYAFHTLPKPNSVKVKRINLFGEEELVDKWLEWKKNLNLISYNSRDTVCSKHFSSEAYHLPGVPTKRKRLIKTAIPSLSLPTSLNNQKKQNRSKARSERINTRELKLSVNQNESAVNDHGSEVQEHQLEAPQQDSYNESNLLTLNEDINSLSGLNIKGASDPEIDECRVIQLLKDTVANSVTLVQKDKNDIMRWLSMKFDELTTNSSSKILEHEYESNGHEADQQQEVCLMCSSVHSEEECTEIPSEIINYEGDKFLEDPVRELMNKPSSSVHEFKLSEILVSDTKLSTATGISTIQMLNAIVDIMEFVNGEKYEQEKFKIKDRVVLTYMLMKHNMSYRSLALIFSISEEKCKRIFITTIKELDQCLSVAIPWPSKEEISKNLPVCFDGFEDTRIILDCTEVFIQHPKNHCCKVMTYSHYKGAATIKFMTGISPAGLLTFVSPMYGGRTSDSAIFKQSKLMQLLEPNDGIMVDRGFLIDKECVQNRWKLIRPAFKKDKKKFTAAEAITSAKIASARVHVERVNARIKSWNIVGGKMPIHLLLVADKIFNVICATVNLGGPVLDDKNFKTI